MEKPSRRRRRDAKPPKVNEHKPPSPERRLNQLRRRELLIDLLEPGVEFFIYTEREWNEPPMTWIRQLRREARRLEDLLIEYGIY